MTQEGSETSVASSFPAPNWWEIHANPLPSWNSMPQYQQQNPGSAISSGEAEDISATSFTNASGHGMDSLSADQSEEPSENHLWTQVLLMQFMFNDMNMKIDQPELRPDVARSVGSSGDLQCCDNDNGENFLEVLSSKTIAPPPVMFDPAACSDYLKKLDSSWDQVTNSSPFNSFEKQLNCYNLTDQVSNWSIAPPNPQDVGHQISPPTSNMTPYSTSSNSHDVKQVLSSALCYPTNVMAGNRNMEYMPYKHEIKGDSQHHEMGSSEPHSLLRPFNDNCIGYQIGLNNPTIIGNKFSNGLADAPWSNTRNTSDLISFNRCLNKPVVDLRPSRPSIKVSDLLDSKKQGCGPTSSVTRGSGRGSGVISEGKNKRSEDSSNSLSKKSKHESTPAVSSLKLHAPKVKLADRIAALQQIVSPFGKTDSASVLLEAINYISFLQEQVQLLSDPYMKSSANKDHSSWGLERKDKTDHDLRSRGLCLVPVSCTPPACRENSGPDYLTPTYRGYMYR